MSNQRHQDEQQHRAERLWRRYLERAGDAGPGQGLDANALAAYLDGKAGKDLAKRVEAAMASDPSLLEEVIELRALAGAKLVAPSEALLARAKALAQGGVTRTGPTHSGPLVLHGFWRRARWAAAAAAIVLACASGYGLGRETFNDALRAEAAETAALTELVSEPDLDGPQANGGNGGES
jgi:anti-sigma factor RsiW